MKDTVYSPPTDDLLELLITEENMGDYTINLAKALKSERAERAKNDVWKSADKCVNRAIVHYVSADGRDYGQIDFHRELPKTKAREIAEKYSRDTESCRHMIEGKYAVDVIESAILEAQGNQS